MNVSLSKILKSCGLENAFLENGYVLSKSNNIVCFTKNKYHYFIFSISSNDYNLLNIDEQILGNYGAVLNGWQREINISNLGCLVEKFNKEWFEVVNSLGGIFNLTLDDIDAYLLSNFHRADFIRKSEHSIKMKIQLYEKYPHQLFENNVLEYYQGSDFIIRFVLKVPFPTIQFINMKSQDNKLKSFYWHSFCNPYCKDYEILDLFIEKAYQFNFNDNIK